MIDRATSGPPVDYTLFALGGGGSSILAHRILTQGWEPGQHFFDLSIDLDHKLTQISTLIGGTGMTNTRLAYDIFPAGTGKNPVLGSFIAQESQQIATDLDSKVSMPRCATIYLTSLQGGTGGGSLPIVKEKLEHMGKSDVSIGFAVLSQDWRYVGYTNIVYNLPKINDALDIVILVELETIAELFKPPFKSKIQAYQSMLRQKMTQRNTAARLRIQGGFYLLFDEYVNRIINMVNNAAINIATTPNASDWRDIRHFLLTMNPNYRTLDDGNPGVHWVVPYLWPLVDDYVHDYRGQTPLAHVEDAIKYGCLCRTSADKVKSTNCILFIEAPAEYLDRHFYNKESIVEQVALQLGMNALGLILFFVPNEDGLRVLLLITPGYPRQLWDIEKEVTQDFSGRVQVWTDMFFKDLSAMKSHALPDLGLTKGDVLTQAFQTTVWERVSPERILQDYKQLLARSLR